MIQGAPCIIHTKGNTESYPSVFLSVNQRKDQFGAFPVAVVKSRQGNLMECQISAVEVDCPNGTPCRILHDKLDYMSVFLGTFDFADTVNAYPVAVIRSQKGRLAAIKPSAVHFPQSAYLFDRKPFLKGDEL